MKIVRWWALPVAVVAVVLVAACGGGSSGTSSSPAPSGVSAASSAPAPAGSPPAALAQQVNSAVAKATSVHVAAVVTQGGITVTADLSLTRANDMYGQMSYKGAPSPCW